MVLESSHLFSRNRVSTILKNDPYSFNLSRSDPKIPDLGEFVNYLQDINGSSIGSKVPHSLKPYQE